VLEVDGAISACDGITNADDMKDLADEVEKRKKKKAAAKPPEEEVKKHAGEEPAPIEAFAAPSAAGAASSSSGAVPVAKPIVHVPKVPTLVKVDENYRKEDVQAVLPPVKGCMCHREAKWHVRWKVQYPAPSPPFSTSRVFTDEEGEAKAIRFIVGWAWERHVASGGEAPPFAIDDLF
jgi:hypothetical protein